MASLEFKQVGIIRAMEKVKNVFEDAKYVEQVWPGGLTQCYIHSSSTGIILSPFCLGENSAWRFAALLLSAGEWYIGDKPYNSENPIAFDSSIIFCKICGGVGRHKELFHKTGQDGGGEVHGHYKLCPAAKEKVDE